MNNDEYPKEIYLVDMGDHVGWCDESTDTSYPRYIRAGEPVAWWDGGRRLTKHPEIPEDHVWPTVIPLIPMSEPEGPRPTEWYSIVDRAPIPDDANFMNDIWYWEPGWKTPKLMSPYAARSANGGFWTHCSFLTPVPPEGDASGRK